MQRILPNGAKEQTQCILDPVSKTLRFSTESIVHRVRKANLARISQTETNETMIS